jgi:hypothetical protein
MAGPDGPMPEQPEVQSEPEFPFEEAVEPEFAAAEPAEEIEAVAPEPEPEPAPPVRRPSAAARASRTARTEGRSSALVWAGAAALAAALIAGAIVFREQIVRIWPRSSAAYAGLGLSVGGGGLVLEQVHVEPAFLAGRPVLAVTGAIRNVRDVPVKAPPVRLTLLNRAGQPVEAKIARPIDALIPARAQRHFAITMLDPPTTARDLEVRFETAVSGQNAPRTTAAVLTPAAPPLAAPAVAPPPPVAPAAPPATVPAAAAPALSPAAASEHG